MRIVPFLMLFSFALGFAQEEITVKVLNVPSSKGKISAALYQDEETFLKFEGVAASKSVAAKKGETQMVFKNVPRGEYAIAIFYDENGNDKLDANWLGIPKEKVAFSKAKMKMFGPPKFKECAFGLFEDRTIVISL